MSGETILICTVGGSHAPIVTAIRELRPCYVCFLCSGRDPGTGRPGSDAQINGKGNCIKANPGDEKPTMPNIPVQAALGSEQYETVSVSTDDLDSAYAESGKAIRRLKNRFPDGRIKADYTGGTKTMSAALVLAALDTGDVELQLVTGNRADLIKIRDGSQFTTPASIDAIRLRKNMEVHLSAWHRHAYGEAAAGLRRIPSPRHADLRGGLFRARELSEAYAAWDQFDHAKALELLRAYAPTLAPEEQKLLGILQRLTQAQNAAKRSAALLFDLYLNAERRASQNRYDDAVARVYRLIEWTAQWTLLQHCGIKTGDIPADFDAAGVDLTLNRYGQRQAGLVAAWSLVQRKTAGAAACFISNESERLVNLLNIRNHSILAHGFTPISEADWRAFHEWLAGAFLPMLREEARGVGIAEMPRQLPSRYEEPHA
jgi:CRISPR-associated protein (TIGR02710 family)